MICKLICIVMFCWILLGVCLLLFWVTTGLLRCDYWLWMSVCVGFLSWLFVTHVMNSVCVHVVMRVGGGFLSYA